MVRSAARFINLLQSNGAAKLNDGAAGELFQQAMQSHNEQMEREKAAHPELEGDIATVGEALGMGASEGLVNGLKDLLANLDKTIGKLENHANGEEDDRPGYL
jgi:hypothetical protein